MTPAETAINAFGGVRHLARAIDVSPSTTSRWTMVPFDMIPVVLRAARQRGIRLTAEQLVLGSPDIGRRGGPMASHAIATSRPTDVFGQIAHALGGCPA